MAISRADLEAESWSFALHVYARPGIADACLKLQGEADVDVMMLLFVAFAAVRHHILLTPEEAGQLNKTCSPWREQIVQPLQRIRSGLKSGPPPAPSEETERYRSQIKAAELDAERLQNRLMTELLMKQLARRGTLKPLAIDADELRSLLRNVVMLFAEERGNQPNAQLVRSIDEIADAAMQAAP